MQLLHRQLEPLGILGALIYPSLYVAVGGGWTWRVGFLSHGSTNTAARPHFCVLPLWSTEQGAEVLPSRARSLEAASAAA